MATLRDKLKQSIEQKSSSLWAGCLYKGDRREAFTPKNEPESDNKKKKLKAGKDLKEYFRFEPYSNHARLALLSAYPDAKKTEKGDILLTELDIFMAFNTIDESFKVNYQKWDATGLAMSCNGSRIYQQRELYEDEFKHKRTRMIECDRPCLIADKPLGAICKNECKQEGELLFYIPQLVNAGVGLPVKMTLHAWSDLMSVSECLNAIATELDEIRQKKGINPDGNIKASPFLCGSFGSVVLLKLSRNKAKIRRPIMENNLRTGKKTEGEAWAVSISFHPAYLLVLRQWQNAIAFSKISLPYAPTGLLEQVKLTPMTAIVALPPVGAIDVTPNDWKINALNWGLSQGLKHETLLAIADRSKSESEFKSFCEKALIIKWAKDSGVDETTAKQLLKDCKNDVELFKVKVEEWLKTVSPDEELIRWAVAQGIDEARAIALLQESETEVDFKDKVFLIVEQF